MKATGLILRNPLLLNRVLSEPDVWREYVIGNYDREKGLPVIKMDQVFEGEVYDVGPITFLDGGSLPTDLALLRGLTSFYADCKYFEIGTWRGESVANMARVAKRSAVKIKFSICRLRCLARPTDVHEPVNPPPSSPR